MINCNGNLIPSITEASESILQSLLTGFTVKETLRYQKNNLLFWELHYFRMMAALRRHRFNIPVGYTLVYLENELIKTIKNNVSTQADFLLSITFIKHQENILFIISATNILPFSINPSDYYSVDLYKEEFISSGFFSNLTNTNNSLRIISTSYSIENGLEDCILLNDKKNLVESIKGTLYLFQGNTILTPNIESGCQDLSLRAAFNEWILEKKTIYVLKEQAINPFELQKSDELMVLSINQGVQNITKYRKTTYNKGKAASLFEKFKESLG